MSTPMPSSFFISSYRSHKVDTAKVIRHLTDTAKEYNIEIPRNAVRASDATTTSDRTVYPIAVNDIVPFARRIMDVSQRPTPISVLKALGRAIPSRRQFTDWYTHQSISDPSLEASNRSHDHFNGVLDKLQEVLTLHSVEASNEWIGEVGGTLDADTAWQTSLGDLGIEPLSQEVPTELLTPDDSASVSETGLITERQPPAVPSQDTYEVEDPAEYVQFAVFNTTKDLQLLRQYIHILLDRYMVKDISLLSLSAIINTAIGVVRRTEKDLMESFSEYFSWEMVMETLVSPPQFEAVFTGSSEYIDTSPQKEFLDSLYCLPFEELRRFRSSIDLDEFPKDFEGQVPISRLEASQIDNIDSWEPDKIVLGEFFREVLSLQAVHKLPTEDELTRGILEVFEGGPVHLWVVFGLQLFLDMQRILGEHVTRPLRELEASGNFYRTIVERYIKLSQVMKRSRFTAKELGIVRKRLGVVDTCISKDIMLELRQDQPSLGTGRPYFFFSHNPVICGLFQFALLLKSQREAIVDLNASGYGLSAAHLYNAAQTENQLTTIWPDMEKLIELREGELFAGGIPKTFDQYISNILRVIGVSIVNFAKDSRSNWKKKAANGPLQLKTPEFMESFEKLLCITDDTPTDISMDLIEAMLHRMALTQSVKRKEQGLIRERWQRNHTLTPIELLKLLEQCMAEEEPKLAFNYFAIYESSFLLLASIKVALGTDFTNWLDREFPNQDSNDNRLLHLLPLYVFGKLETVQMKSKAVTTEDDILARVGRVIDDFVSRKPKDPSPTIAGGFNDQDLTTDFEHGTQNGVCIHWGRCDRTGSFANPTSQ